jgi:hypothetical protein
MTILGSVALSLTAVGVPQAGSSQSASTATSLPHEEFQLRPVIGGATGKCPMTDVRYTPSALRPVRLRFPAAHSCESLGPAVLSARSVKAVIGGHTSVGAPDVSVELTPRDVAILKRSAAKGPGALYAVVVLGKILSTPTGTQFAAIGPAGQFQIAGGPGTPDRLAQVIAQALRSPLHTAT